MRRSQAQSRLSRFKKGRRYARRVMSNPHPYWQVANGRHPEPTTEWIERTLMGPYTAEEDETEIGRVVYYGYVPEVEKWLVVVAQDDRLFNAYFNRNLLRLWGKPE